MFTALPLLAALSALPAQAQDHLTDHNWLMEIEGVTTGAFKGVDGLDSEVEVRLIDPEDLDRDLVAWLESGTKAEPLDLVLIEVDEEGVETRYLLFGATPVATKTGEIEMVIERLEKG